MATEVFINTKKTKLGEALGINLVRIAGLGGLASAASETIVNYIESPFADDVYILRAWAHIKTADAQDADMDIGIADDKDGTNCDDSLSTSLVNSAKGVLRLAAAQDGAGVACPLWKKKGSAAGSFIVAEQNGNVDASDLEYDLYLEVFRASDLLD